MGSKLQDVTDSIPKMVSMVADINKRIYVSIIHHEVLTGYTK